MIDRVRHLNWAHAEYRDCAASRLESACSVLPWGRILIRWYTLCLEVNSGLLYKVSKTRRAPSLFLETVLLNLELKSFTQKGNWKVYNNVSIQINHQPDTTIFQFIILTLICSSTCFGRFLAHHQELNDCSGSLWFYLGRAGRPDHEHSTTITMIRR